MSAKILFIERKPSNAVSIEKVFRQIAGSLSRNFFAVAFQQMRYGNDALGTVKNLLFFRKEPADIYHVTGHVYYIALILPRRKTVLTVHDVGILHIRSGLRRLILKKLLFDLPVRRLNFITAVSEQTKRELVRYTGCDERKIRVIENPLQEHFFLSEKKEFSRESPSILQIGTTANKNLGRLVEALAGIECRLTIIGELNAEILAQLQAKKIKFINKTHLSNEEIKEEYTRADLVTFCSTFEGFGLPVIEAQAMLTPVVTSDISPLKEVAGDGAAFADPEDSASIRKSILEVMGDEGYRRRLVAAGIENVKRYRAEKIARQYENLYGEIIAGKNT